MADKKPISIKNYILILVVSPSVALIIAVATFLAVGFGWKGTLIMVILIFPLWLFLLLYSFYKGLVKHYGFEGHDKLFFGGWF